MGWGTADWFKYNDPKSFGELTRAEQFAVKHICTEEEAQEIFKYLPDASGWHDPLETMAFDLLDHGVKMNQIIELLKVAHWIINDGAVDNQKLPSRTVTITYRSWRSGAFDEVMTVDGEEAEKITDIKAAIEFIANTWRIPEGSIEITSIDYHETGDSDSTPTLD